jgi:uncharacterized membrane protein YgcG
VLIFIDKGHHKTYIGVDNKTEEVFGADRKQALKSTIEAQFRHNDYDAGILAGVSYVRSTLQAQTQAPVVPVNRSYAPPPVQTRPANSGHGGLFALLFFGFIVIVGILILVAIVRGIFRAISGGGGGMVNQVGPGYNPGPGFGPGPGYGPGYPAQQGGGGGFLSSFLGGAGGAIAGNALYDHFEHRNEGYQGPINEPGGGFAGPVVQSQPDWQSPGTNMDYSDQGSSWGSCAGSSCAGSSCAGSSCSGGGSDWS